MDDNNFATSEASHEDSHFATEIENDVPAVVEAEPEAPASEASKLPKAPKTSREALEEAFDKVEEKEAPQAEAKPEVEVPPVDLGAGPKTVKAPASWKPAAREKFDALPPEVREEVARREYDIDATLAKTSAERRLAHEFMQAAGPYQADYQAMGINPVAAAQNFFQVDRALRVGTVAQKAELVGNLIRQYGIDLGALDTHLAGQAPAQPQNQGHDSELAARVARMEQATQQQQQSVVQAQQNQINTTIDQFANDPKNEFFNDVAPHMIGLLQSGAAPDLKAAYEQACYANPSVRNVLTQRQQSTQAKLAAGNVSLPNKGPRNGSAQPVQKFKSTRDALEAAFAAQAKQDRV